MACSFQPDALAKYFVSKGADGKKVANGGTKFAHFTNPVQSFSMKNCHLIAALSSIAWVNKAFFPDKGNVGPYNFNFYDNGSIPVSVTKNLFSDGAIPCGATSNNWDAADHESWPPLWEKAFAKFCMYKILKNSQGLPYYSLADLQNSAKDPVYSLLPKGSDWGGNPVTVMKWILNKPALYFAPRDASFTYGVSTYNNFYDLIKKGICKTSNIPAGCNGAKTLAYMGAWTYLNNVKANEHSQSTVVYDTTALVADHCYSLLGIFEENAKRYIVLRNPFGKYDPTHLPIGTGPWNYKDGASTLTFNFTPNDGIFALEESTFKDYFEWFGVVG